MSEDGIRKRWTARLATARHWAAVWRQRYMWNPSRHNKWKMEQWRARVSEAEKVLRRHGGGVTGISEQGLELIKGFEGFRSAPYRDAVGVWTIGYGETAGIGPNTRPWSQAYAERRLKERVNRDYMKPVLKLGDTLNLRLTQNEADALASLVYNLGPGILNKGKTMGNALRTRNRRSIADAFLVYDHAGGRQLDGLTRRRRRERQLFLS